MCHSTTWINRLPCTLHSKPNTLKKFPVSKGVRQGASIIEQTSPGIGGSVLAHQERASVTEFQQQPCLQGRLAFGCVILVWQILSVPPQGIGGRHAPNAALCHDCQ